MFHPRADIALHQSLLRERRRTQLPHAVAPALANQLLECLRHEVRWTHAFRDGDRSQTLDATRYAALPEAERLALLERSYAQARTGAYQFAYDSYMMITAYLEGRDPGLLLHRILEQLNAPATLDWLRQLTGCREIVRASAQATRYRPGHFLRPHNDFDASEGRRFAYVLNLSPDWQADWGGLLHFLDPQGAISETLFPQFNSLTVFAVPQQHFVSQVSSFATGERLAITGWMEA